MSKYIETKYSGEIFFLGFLGGFIATAGIFYLTAPANADWNNSDNISILVIPGILTGILFGFCFMMGSRRVSIKVSFENKEEFMHKIDASLYQIGYKKDYDNGDFLSYKYSSGIAMPSSNINITINNKEAKISGLIGIMRKFEKVYH